MATTELRAIDSRSPGYRLLLAALAALLGLGLFGAWTLEHHGHVASGMDNQVVWGLPHVFAVFLIVASSGALNVASMASVFGKTGYKPLAPLSGLLALALLAGGLSVLLLDLGRPDRLIVAITHTNPRSIFAWNVLLYSGFAGLVLAYLWTLMEHRMQRYTPVAGLLAFLWRLALTTGTGSIFGFLVSRHAYGSAVLAPLFIALSLSYGLAVFVLVLGTAGHGTGRPPGGALLARLGRLQAIFVATALLLVAIHHLGNLYQGAHLDYERFILRDGGLYPVLFWLGQVTVGSLLPLALLLLPPTPDRRSVLLAALLVVLGGLAQMYVTLIGGQAFPLDIFPGLQVSSGFHDGRVADYAPRWPEWLLGIGGLALAGLIVTLALALLRFLPGSLEDTDAATGH